MDKSSKMNTLIILFEKKLFTIFQKTNTLQNIINGIKFDFLISYEI